MSQPSRVASHIALPFLDVLEPRLLLAGDVSAVLRGATLHITGDDLDNQMTIGRDGVGGYRLIPTNGTTVNGQADVFDFAIPGNIIIRMNGGDDFVTFQNAIRAEENLQIDLGAGEDEVVFDAMTVDGNLVVAGGDGIKRVNATGTEVRGGLKVSTTTGAGLVVLAEDLVVRGATTVTSRSTALAFTSSSGHFERNVSLTQKGQTSSIIFNNDAGGDAWIHGSLKVRGGGGSDSVSLLEGTIAGKVTCVFGPGADQSNLSLDAMTCQAGVSMTSSEADSRMIISDSAVTGSLSLVNSAGLAVLTVANHSTVGQSLLFKASRGNATAMITSLEIGGKATICSGAKVRVEWGSGLHDSTVGSSLTIKGKTDQGICDLSYTAVGGAMSVSLGSGDTILELEGVTVGGRLSHKSGTGADTLNLIGVTGHSTGAVSAGGGNDILTVQNCTFTGRVTALMGDGNDTANFQPQAGANTFLNGGLTVNAGSGDDGVNVGSADVDGRQVLLGAASTADGGAGTNGGQAHLHALSLPLTWKNVT